MFKRIGDCCGGFLDVDLDTEYFTQLQWARILVKTESEDLPRSLQVVMGSSCFAIQLWWEVPARLSVVVPAKLKNRGPPECVRAGTMEKIGTKEGVSTNASETRSKVNNVSPWVCVGSEKGATDGTSLLVEVSKSRTNVCVGKGGEDKGKEEESGGCPRFDVSQSGLELKEKRKGVFIGKEVRRWTKAQLNGPKSIVNKNDKMASTKISSRMFEACIQDKALEEDQAQLLAQSSLIQDLYLGGRKSPRPVTNSSLSNKEVSGSIDVRMGGPAAGLHHCCDVGVGLQGWKSQISKEVGLSRINQATNEMLREEGSRYALYISRGSRELSSSTDFPSILPSSGKSMDMVLARDGFYLNKVDKDKEERIFPDPLKVNELEIAEGGIPLVSEGFFDKTVDRGCSPLWVSPLAVWASKGSKGKVSCPRDRVSPSLEDVSLVGQDSLLPLSVFGRVLLPGGFSGAGGSDDVEDKDDHSPRCMVAMNGKEGEMLTEGSLMEVKVRTEIFPVDLEERYESWEESCMVKFSEYLGFSTKGHECEILSLLRRLTVKQNQMRPKGQQVVSRCERELKKLECTMKYKGQWYAKGPSKNKGDLQQKLR